MPAQPHSPPSGIPAPTFLIPWCDYQGNGRRPLLLGLIAFVKEIDAPRKPAGPVPASTTREGSSLSPVKFVKVCLRGTYDTWARSEWEMGRDSDVAQLTAGNVE